MSGAVRGRWPTRSSRSCAPWPPSPAGCSRRRSCSGTCGITARSAGRGRWTPTRAGFAASSIRTARGSSSTAGASATGWWRDSAIPSKERVISPGHRRRLNRAMHELRRPLQALVLLDEPPGDPGQPAKRGAESARRGLLELARSALASLDAEVNGASPLPARREVSCRELVHAALERWRPLAVAAGGVRLYWDVGAAPAVCDPMRLAQALDNLLAIAVEHRGRFALCRTGSGCVAALEVPLTHGGLAQAA